MNKKLPFGEEMKKGIQENLYERRKNAIMIRKSVLKYSLLILGLFLIAFAVGGWYIYDALQPVDENNHSKTKIEIPMGSGTTAISTILEKNGIVKNAKIFKYYLKFNNEAGFQAGKYEMSPSMTMKQIAKELKSGRITEKIVKKILVPEGKRLDEIADIIAKETGRKKAEVLKKMNNRSFVKALQTEHPDLISDAVFAKDVRYPLEGYLFPATYGFTEMEPSVDEIVKQMVNKTAEVMSGYEDQLGDKWTVHKLLTMASIIEEESTAKVNRSKISAVFENRMKIKMPLQSDVTVLYALGVHKERVLYKDLEVDSPYNTYKNNDWIPGPIASPGEKSIKAALKPAKTNDLYFITTPEGKGVFAVTLEEHNRNVAKYLR